jgi:DNA-directed RNA polymerase subunit N (RpoN/RPB10)
MKKNGKALAKPYPRRCAACGQISVSKCYIPYNAEILHGGKLHKFLIPNLGIDRCESCGEQFFTTSTDGQIERFFQYIYSTDT